MPTVKSGTKYNGVMNIMGNMIQAGATLPHSYSPNDFIMLAGALLVSAYAGNDTFYNSIELSDLNAGLNIRCRYSGGYIKFYLGSQLVLNLDAGMLLLGGTGVPAAPITSQTGDIWTTVDNVFGAAYAAAGSGVYGSYKPQDANGDSFITNTYSGGNVRVRISNGTNGTAVIAFQVNPNGRIISQAGGSFADIPSARMALNSTTEGF